MEKSFTERLMAAVEPFRHEWKGHMVGKYREQYAKVHDRLDYSRQRYEEFQQQIDALSVDYIANKKAIMQTTKMQRPFASVLKAEAAQYGTCDDFLRAKVAGLDEMYDTFMKKLPPEMMNKGIRIDEARIEDVNMTDAHLNVLVTDSDKAVGASLTWKNFDSWKNNEPVWRTTASDWQQQKNKKQIMADAGEIINRGGHLKDRLMNVLDFSKDDWKQRMLALHSNYFDYIQSKLPLATVRKAELAREIEIRRKLEESPVRIKALQKLQKMFALITNSRATEFESREYYLKTMDRKWDNTWQECLEHLAQACIRQGLDDRSAKVVSVDMDGKRMNVVLKDEMGNRSSVEIMARGAGNSVTQPSLQTKVVEMVKVDINREKDKELVSSTDVQYKSPRDLVTEAKVIKYNGRLLVGCHIDGVPQRPVPIKPELWEQYKSSTELDKTGLAIAHFPRELAQAIKTGSSMEQETRIHRNFKF